MNTFDGLDESCFDRSKVAGMEISIQSNELIDALSKKIASLTVELETTRLALQKTQEAIVELEQTASDSSWEYTLE